MEKPIFKATAIAVLVFSMFTASMVAPAMLQKSGVVDDAPNFFITVHATDATVSECGIINIFVVDETQIDTLKGADISETATGVYAHFDASPPTGDFDDGDGETLDGNIPYNTEFGIIIQTQYNYTVAYNVSTPGWDTDYVSAELTSTDLGLSSQAMTETSFYTTTGSSEGDTGEIHFYYSDGTEDSWELSHGETVSCDVVINGFW